MQSAQNCQLLFHASLVWLHLLNGRVLQNKVKHASENIHFYKFKLLEGR